MAANRSHSIEADRSEPGRAPSRLRARHDWQRDGSVVVSVVEAVAAATETAPTAIEPLYEVFDPDAMEDLLDSLGRGSRSWIEFSLHGCDVTVYSSGIIEVRPLG